MNTYKYTVNDRNYTVEIEEIEGQVAKVSVNGRPFTVNLHKPISHTTINRHPVHVEPPVVVRPTVAEPAPAPIKNETKAIGADDRVTAPLPGTIVEILMKEGDSVNQGETVLILEAMKMQNSIEADKSGTITSITVKEGDTVMEGQVLFTIG